MWVSEYQYYEFQAIDRALTYEEQQAVAALSSRVEPHPRQAIFVYNWSDFRGDPEAILRQYDDAMLYMANWGSRQLMFRWPCGVLDLESASAYCQPLIVQDYLSFSAEGDHVILNIEFHDEETVGWADGEGWLAAMLSLRDDILHGDYRALYLAWLKVLEVEDVLEPVLEPPVPPRLGALSPALHRFVEFFEIDEALIQVAAEASGEGQEVAEDWVQRALSQLAADERDAFLLRLAQGEPYLSIRLSRRLREILPPPQSRPRPPRTVGQLLHGSEERRKREERRRAEEAEARRVRELEALARRELEAWAEVESLIEQMQARSYDDAVALLVKLHDLARHQGEEAAFQAGIDHLSEKYSRRSSLIRRMRNAGLYGV
jgi:hypothetical protein